MSGLGARRQRGFVLVAVTLVLGVMGALAFLMTREGALEGEVTLRSADADRARYVAEAGLRHATWLADRSSCAAYGMPDTPFGQSGQDHYQASFTPPSGSPVTVSATATLADGSTHVRESTLSVYEPPVTLVLQPGAEADDTWLYQWKSTWNYGNGNYLRAVGSSDSRSVSLLRFDLAAVPSSARVLSATLELNVSDNSWWGGPISVHRVTSDWEEGTSNACNCPGANWTEATPTALWNTPGGDYDPTPADTTHTSGLGWYAWDVTALVGDWVAGRSANHGFLLAPDTLAAEQEFVSGDDTDATKHPKLTIVYACECGSGGADAHTLQPGASAGKDGWITGGKPDWNFGAATSLAVVESAPQRSLLEFDLSSLPAGALVQSARLELFCHNVQTAGAVDVHAVTDAWQEGSCQGSGCVADGATWDTRDGVALWSAPGTDHEPDPAASQTVDVQNAWYTWDVSGLVAAWAAGMTPNHGMLLKGSFGGANVDFSSSDATDSTLHPKLVVDYTCPCGGCAGAAGGGTYRDEFTSLTCDASVDYFGSDGTLDWSGFGWEEVGEPTDPCSQGVRILETSGNRVARFAEAGKGLRRQVDLSMLPTAALTFDYMREGPWSDSTDRLAVRVSADGGSTWTEVGAIPGPGADAEFQTASFDITAYRSSSTVVEFTLENTSTGSETISIDNVQIAEGAPTPTLTLDAVADTRLEKSTPDDNFGADPQLALGAPGGGGPTKPSHALLRFDVSSVPAGATVTSATLRLQVEAVEGSGSIDVGAYRITAPWVEGTGTSASPTTDGATWNNTGGGGTYDPAQLDQVSVPLAPGTVSWSLPPGLIHEWIDGIPAPGTDYGVILVYEGNTKGKRALPASREHADAGLRPQLVLEYTLP